MTPKDIIAQSIRTQFAIHPQSVTAENLNNDGACSLLSDCAIASLDSAGYVIVPKVPSLKMLAAACDDCDKNGQEQGYTSAWQAMIAASTQKQSSA